MVLTTLPQIKQIFITKACIILKMLKNTKKKRWQAKSLNTKNTLTQSEHNNLSVMWRKLFKGKCVGGVRCSNRFQICGVKWGSVPVPLSFIALCKTEWFYLIGGKDIAFTYQTVIQFLNS